MARISKYRKGNSTLKTRGRGMGREALGWAGWAGASTPPAGGRGGSTAAHSLQGEGAQRQCHQGIRQKLARTTEMSGRMMEAQQRNIPGRIKNTNQGQVKMSTNGVRSVSCVARDSQDPAGSEVRPLTLWCLRGEPQRFSTCGSRPPRLTHPTFLLRFITAAKLQF